MPTASRSLFAFRISAPTATTPPATISSTPTRSSDYQFELFHDAMRGLSDFNAPFTRSAFVGG